MKRLRLVFVLLSALLWLPLSLLVVFALRTVEQEEAGRYKAVADRIFDELERELTGFLRREEERPASAYDAGQGVMLAAPEAAFVLGYFERDARGTLRHGPWSDAASQLLAQAFGADAKPDGAERSQLPGSTLELKRKDAPLAKSYDVLSQLNRSVSSREESKRKSRGKSAANDLDLFDEPQALQAYASLPASQPSSLRAQSVGAQHMLLVRDAERAGATVQQGLLISLPRLLESLSERVLARGELRQAARVVALDAANPYSRDLPEWTRPDRGYQHRFGEPFASMSAQLSLDTLPELETSPYLYVLFALLLLLGALALYAGYRMVAAVVGYAERRNDFVSAVTHELKTPLTAIRMYGEMLRDDVVPEPQKRSRYYRIITAESERLTRLIENVLELARIERGQRSVSLAMGDVATVVRETLEVLEPHASDLGFKLELQTSGDLPEVCFDRDALSQVLFNLVDNALKYSAEASQRTITIHCEAQPDAVLVRVADRGPGVAPQHLARIWQPFYRAERELTRTHKGTGIGLALVRGLVERMGGQVAGRNTNPGFEVRVLLPLPTVGSNSV
ncbi:MAG TPA: HAMP domain-containing sensor histidine kinase [Polyangiales bacterium]|nr:HAMP domain-containing sensor histidine kinase [Polyangiales bacterium]